jgi:hypothetical protein
MMQRLQVLCLDSLGQTDRSLECAVVDFAADTDALLDSRFSSRVPLTVKMPFTTCTSMFLGSTPGQIDAHDELVPVDG